MILLKILSLTEEDFISGPYTIANTYNEILTILESDTFDVIFLSSDKNKPFQRELKEFILSLCVRYPKLKIMFWIKYYSIHDKFFLYQWSIFNVFMQKPTKENFSYRLQHPTVFNDIGIELKHHDDYSDIEEDFHDLIHHSNFLKISLYDTDTVRFISYEFGFFDEYQTVFSLDFPYFGKDYIHHFHYRFIDGNPHIDLPEWFVFLINECKTKYLNKRRLISLFKNKDA
jgi:hypothetical protein